jgi:hypothetical protein
MTKAFTLLTSLIPRLMEIRAANGYATNAGSSVLLGPVPRQPDETYPFCRLHELNGTVETPMPHRPTGRLRVQFMAEAYADEADAANVYATGHLLIGDLKKALFGDTTRDLNGLAIDAALESYNLVPPEDGSSVVIAQVRGSYTFTEDFRAP